MSLSSIMKDWIVAFQADDSNLTIIQGENRAVSNLQLGMMPGTSPSVGTSEGDPFIAFQANTSYLWVWTEQGALDTKLGMMPGTSPSATKAPGWGKVIAFQANTGNLWFWSEKGGTVDTKLGMMGGTSPSIFADYYGSFGIVFQANTNNLWGYYPDANVGRDMLLGMMPGASPAVSKVSNSAMYYESGTRPSHRIAFQANTGSLWLSDKLPYLGHDTKLGIRPGSNPSIIFEQVAFQSPQGSLWVADGSNGKDLALGMWEGTSPAIGFKWEPFEYYIAFQANTGNLWVTHASLNNGSDTGLKMMPGTSPAVLPTR